MRKITRRTKELASVVPYVTSSSWSLNVFLFRVKTFSSSETWMRVCGQSGRKGKEEQEKTAKRRCKWETRKREREI